MSMAKILNHKFSGEIDIGIRKNEEYINADNEIRKFIQKEFPKEKAERLDELLDILTSIVGNTYAEEGIKLGAKSTSESIFDKYFV